MDKDLNRRLENFAEEQDQIHHRDNACICNFDILDFDVNYIDVIRIILSKYKNSSWETMKQSDQSALLSLMQSGVLVETKFSKTRRVEFKCSVIAASNSTQKLRKPLLSRFAIINVPDYTKEQFIGATKDRLGDNQLTEYIAEQVWNSSKSPNIRDCVRISAVAKCEQDVLMYLRVLGSGSGLGESKAKQR